MPGKRCSIYEDCETEIFDVNGHKWRKLQRDNSYMREIMIGQVNNCLTEITKEKAEAIIDGWLSSRSSE